MPATSEKQKKFMDAAAHNSSFAKAAGVPQNVAKEFSEKSKGLKFGKGSGSRADLQKVNKPKTDHGKSNLFKEGGHMKEPKAMMAKEVSFMKKKGAPKSMIKHEMAEAKMAKGGIATSLKAHASAPASKAHAGMKTGGMAKMPGYKDGGMPMVMKDGKKVPAFAADGEGKMAKGGMTKKMNMGGMGYAKGGGVETKGKTKGTMVTMKRGGKTC
jgi:hypothetical protein